MRRVGRYRRTPKSPLPCGRRRSSMLVIVQKRFLDNVLFSTRRFSFKKSTRCKSVLPVLHHVLFVKSTTPIHTLLVLLHVHKTTISIVVGPAIRAPRHSRGFLGDPLFGPILGRPARAFCRDGVLDVAAMKIGLRRSAPERRIPRSGMCGQSGNSCAGVRPVFSIVAIVVIIDLG